MPWKKLKKLLLWTFSGWVPYKVSETHVFNAERYIEHPCPWYMELPPPRRRWPGLMSSSTCWRKQRTFPTYSLGSLLTSALRSFRRSLDFTSISRLIASSSGFSILTTIPADLTSLNSSPFVRPPPAWGHLSGLSSSCLSQADSSRRVPFCCASAEISLVQSTGDIWNNKMAACNCELLCVL